MTEIIEINDISILKEEYSILLHEYFRWMFQNYEKHYPVEWKAFQKNNQTPIQNQSDSPPFEIYVGFLLSENQIKKYLPPDGHSYIAKTNGETSGMGSLCKLDKEKRIGEIKRLYVRPQYRGKKIGKELLEKTLSKAKEIGYEKIRLETIGFMKTATKMYLNYGFKEIKQYEGSEAPEGLSQLNIYMELNI